MKKLIIILLIISFIFLAGLSYVKEYIYPLNYVEHITHFGRLYDVDPLIIAAVIKTESGFNPNAVSRSNAKGLMQLTDDTLFWLYSKTPEKEEHNDNYIFIPEHNIKYGTLNLSILLKKYEDFSTALAAYNAGQGRTDKWLVDSRYSDDGKCLKDIPYSETKNYVKKVKFNLKIYKLLYPNLKKGA